MAYPIPYDHILHDTLYQKLFCDKVVLNHHPNLSMIHLALIAEFFVYLFAIIDWLYEEGRQDRLHHLQDMVSFQLHL